MLTGPVQDWAEPHNQEAQALKAKQKEDASLPLSDSTGKNMQLGDVIASLFNTYVPQQFTDTALCQRDSAEYGIDTLFAKILEYLNNYKALRISSTLI